MEIQKPLQLGVLYKSFSYLEKNLFTVSIPIGFSLTNGEILLEQKLWEVIGEQLDGEIFDAAMPKEVGEVLVAGSFIPPNNQKVEAGSVKLTVKSKTKQGTYQTAVEKELAIFGDRHWYKLLGAGITPSSPELFTEMPITYQKAFGGEGFKPNPGGKGAIEVTTDFGERQFLPNIEYKSNLITSPGSKPQPASFGRIDIMNTPRVEKAGTFDQKYIETRMPGLPDDVNWLYFNDAAEDQWLDGFFNGDEQFSITNMHAKHQELSGTLPPIYGRAFVNQQVPVVDNSGNATGKMEIQFKEIPTKLDTLYLFPNSDLGVMIYRGTIAAYSDIGSDIKALLLACENRKDTPRTLAHYQDQLTKRLDLKHGYKYALFSAPLIAEGMKCGFQQIQEDFDFPLELLAKDNLESFGERSLLDASNKIEDAKLKVIEQCKVAGVDPTPYLEKINNPEKADEQIQIEAMLERMMPGILTEPDNIDIFNIDLTVLDEIKAYQEQMVENARQQTREHIEKELELIKQSSDAEALAPAISEIEQIMTEMDMPPMWPRLDMSPQLSELRQQLSEAELQISELRGAGIPESEIPKIDFDADKLEQQIIEAGIKHKETYLMGAHLMGEMRSPHPEKEQNLKQQFLQQFKSGESLVSGDYACIDVSGEDLTGIDLSDCYLEGVNFANCNLTNAKLSKAILASANLENAILRNADCQGANIGAANLTDADFTDANLAGCQLGGSNFTRAKLINCPMAEGNFLDTTFEQTIFNGSELKKCNFVNPVFRNCEFIETDLAEANFVEGQFVDCDFTKAILDGVNFVKAISNNNNFQQAQMINVRFVGGCELNGSDFTGIDGSRACFRENQLVDAKFDQAKLDEADFSGSQLDNASFQGAKAYRTQFMQSQCKGASFKATNLMEGSMYKAYLVSADFSKANLYSVNFLDSTLGNNTYSGANLDQTILKEWRP